jgi:hypothetical protein
LVVLLFASGALPPGVHAAEPAPLTVKHSEGVYEVFAAKQLVTSYYHAESVAKPYFWPVNSPLGTTATRGWPMVKGLPGETTDHVHQKSLWFCHGDVIPEGLELKVRSADQHIQGVDYWSEVKNHGKIVCTEAGEPKSISKTHVLLPTKNEWRTPDGITILKETRIIHIQSLESGFLISLEIELSPTDYPIVFGDTKEGSMGVRVHDALRSSLKDGATITANNGTTLKAPQKDNLSIWGQPAAWHDYSGTVNGKNVGIAIFDAPTNPSPALWHTRAYGLMAANPFAREKSGFPAAKGKKDLIRIEKGKSLKLRFGVYVHDGDAQSAQVDKVYSQFVGK